LALWFSGIEDNYLLPKYSLDGEEHEVSDDYQQAHQLLAEGKRQEAINKFLVASKEHDGYLPAFIMLNRIYTEDKNKDESINVTGEIIKQSLTREEPAMAVEAFQRFTKAFPDGSLRPIMQFRIATTLSSRGLYQEAAWAYRNLAANYPSEPLAQKSLLASADILTNKLAMHENAITMYEHYLKHYSQGNLVDHARRGLEKARKSLGRPPS